MERRPEQARSHREMYSYSWNAIKCGSGLAREGDISLSKESNLRPERPNPRYTLSPGIPRFFALRRADTAQ